MSVVSPKYEAQYSKQNLKRVKFTGSTALVQGQGLCYDRDFNKPAGATAATTATDAEGRRSQYVELPTTSNNFRFAGVCIQDYGARTGGQWITIAEPGSVVEIAHGIDTVVNSTRLTCVAGSGTAGGIWCEGGYETGRGTALALQTTTIGGNSRDATGALDDTGLILTDSSETFVTDGVQAGQHVAILAGEDDGTNAVTQGLYEIASVDSETQLTLTTAASDGGTMEVTYSAPIETRCLAYLYDGKESGMAEFLQLTNGAVVSMVGGTSFIHGGVDLSADATEDLSATTAYGPTTGIHLKYFHMLAIMTTNDYVLTLTGIQIDGSTALATLTFDGANDRSLVEFRVAEWYLLDNVGTAVA